MPLQNAISNCLMGSLIVFCWWNGTAVFGQSPNRNPVEGEVSLGSLNGWNSFLILDNNKVGIWTVEAFDVVDEFGSLEVVGLDDAGHVHVLTSYSGKWSPRRLVNDGKWLGGLALGDVDPRLDGNEIYVGSQQGNLYQIVVHANAIMDYRLIGQIPGREIHTILANPFEIQSLLVFTHPGGIHLLKPTANDGKFSVDFQTTHDGRIRQAVKLPVPADAVPVWATVSRNGRLDLLRWDAGKPDWNTVHQELMGLGRIALSPASTSDNVVLYATCDDGRVIRLQSSGLEKWQVTTIHAGDQGPRGIVVGRFTFDATADEVAICGYNEKVELLRESEGRWTAQTIFEDIDKGHWLAKAELDGRNSTDELLITGYGGRIVMLCRPPGYGLTPGSRDK